MIKSFKKISLGIFMIVVATCHSISFAKQPTSVEIDSQPPPISLLADLHNFQVNTPNMLSSGLPTQKQFEALQTMGVTRVIDLLPGDRSAEISLLKALNLAYHNIPVDWENPTVKDFDDYVKLMKEYGKREGLTLTHCKLNWRGAVFTYLYRITQLKEPEESAIGDLFASWPQPNEKWQTFMNTIKAKYH